MRDRWAQLLRERAATQSSLTETARNRRISFATLIEAPDLALYRDKRAPSPLLLRCAVLTLCCSCLQCAVVEHHE